MYKQVLEVLVFLFFAIKMSAIAIVQTFGSNLAHDFVGGAMDSIALKIFSHEISSSQQR